MTDAAIHELAERMIASLVDQPIETRAMRIETYWRAGISLAHYSDHDWRAADEIARDHELNRRVSQ